MIFFTSDTHFDSERTRVLSRRPFKTVEEMNNVMVENWNNVVKPNDTVYHLGDFGNIEFAKKLNGNICILKGNYEYKDYDDIELANSFENVIHSKIMYVNLSEAVTAVCVHEPENTDFKEFTLFGHIHKAQQIKKNGLNVGVDCHNFTPLSLDDILFYKNAIDNFYDNNVFM